MQIIFILLSPKYAITTKSVSEFNSSVIARISRYYFGVYPGFFVPYSTSDGRKTGDDPRASMLRLDMRDFRNGLWFGRR